jgi:parallel beta-helix repeat protein
MHNIRAMRVVVIAACLWNLSAAGEAATTEVDCSAASLQAAVDTAKPGDTFLVSGTCDEHVAINADVSRVTLDGQGKATINGQDKTKPTLFVKGKEITIKGFTVSGGQRTIEVSQGGNAVIDGNTIKDGALAGIAVLFASSAAIVNNTIQGHDGFAGIGISFNSVANIGVLSWLDETASPNVIRNNKGHGILVARSSAAFIVGNSIGNNEGQGVFVSRSSNAQIANNSIDGNRRGGILVSRNSGVDLGEDRGKPIRNLPNKTSTKNGRFGVRCSRSGYIDGRLGTLNGTEGTKNFDEGCIDSLKP